MSLTKMMISPSGVALVVSLVLLVKLGVHLPTVLRGFLFYIQIAPIAVAYFPDIFGISTEVVGSLRSRFETL